VRLALATGAVVLVVLVWELLRPRVIRAIVRVRVHRELVARRREASRFDPGRELRAEQRARRLLHSCVPREAWEMYRDLGFIRVWGSCGEAYAYLIHPHRPILAYVPQTGALLSEYCVAFPDESRPFGSSRLPDADDVLAKWMALSADEHGLIEQANMHLPGRQIDPDSARSDLARLARWEHARSEGTRAGIVRAA
jgi:hypothetical protein